MTEISEEAATAVSKAAARLDAATAALSPCAPIRDLLGSTDVAGAYEVQRLLSEARIARGARVIGRKIGLTSEAVQNQLGVDQPDFGVLFEDMQRTGTDQIEVANLLQPKIEAEIAFTLAEDLDSDDFSPQRIRAAVKHASAALEIVDSRIANWDISIVDTIADNGSSALFVLGDLELTLEEFEPSEVSMYMNTNGSPVSEGNGAACLGDPLIALAWLARTAYHQGTPLLAGQVILSGALGPMSPVVAGDVVTAEISSLGSVTAMFTGGQES